MADNLKARFYFLNLQRIFYIEKCACLAYAFLFEGGRFVHWFLEFFLFSWKIILDSISRTVISFAKTMKKHELCNHCFSKKSSLLNHVASVHEEKKHFECEFWEKKCSVKSNLNIHVSRLHKQEKPFKCELCNHCFPRKISLLNHVASIHEEK